MSGEVWHVLWDNGFDACGEFPWNFATEEEARQCGEDWLVQFRIDNDIDDDESQPSFDVIEVGNREPYVPLHRVEGTTEHFDRYQAGDR